MARKPSSNEEIKDDKEFGHQIDEEMIEDYRHWEQYEKDLLKEIKEAQKIRKRK